MRTDITGQMSGLLSKTVDQFECHLLLFVKRLNTLLWFHFFVSGMATLFTEMKEKAATGIATNLNGTS